MLKRTKKFMAILLAATVIASTSMTSLIAFAADEDKWTEAPLGSAWTQWCNDWEEIKNDWTQISLTPGKNAKELNFAWYSLEGEVDPLVRISKNADMSESVLVEGNQSNAVLHSDKKGNPIQQYMTNKATVTELEENTTYYYSYGTNGEWSEVESFKTQSTDSFGFILVGDPQIGSSSKNTSANTGDVLGQDNATRNDTFNWNNTINSAVSKLPNASFILSAGDQIQSRDKKANAEQALNYTENEIEYAGYLSPQALKGLPVATSLGNHDAISGNYSFHFNNPNASDLGSTIGGGDYYFRYGNTLFIMLNTNNTNAAQHEEFINKAVAENEDATWRVVTLHQDIYGSAEHSNEPEIAELRYNLVPIFEENNVDVVLTGHDHAYTRSKILKGGSLKGELMEDDAFADIADEEYETEIPSTNEEYLAYLESIEDKEAIVTDLDVRGENISNPDGILYITAGSSTGSKYYNNLIRQQSYVANRWQEYVPTYSTIKVDDVSFSISTYRTDSNELIDDTVTIIKSVEYANLVEKIKEAETMVANKSMYTASTWNAFEAILLSAQEAAEANLSETEMNEVYGNLTAAIAQLEEKGDVSKLNETIIAAKELADKTAIGTEVGQVAQEVKDALVSAITTAEVVLVCDDVNQGQVDEAVKALNSAVKTFNAAIKVEIKDENTTGNGGNSSTGGSTSNGGNSSTNNPSTGDTFNLGAVVVSILSLVGIGSVVFFEAKKKKQSV